MPRPARRSASRLVILGHHYQRDEVIRFADYTGDSFRLARQIANRPDADYIVFCGVHFMAESADVLCAPHQQVILPDLAAGCSMADMAEPGSARDLLGRADADGRCRRRAGDLHQLGGVDQGVRRRARRHRLHVVERDGDAEVGVRARREGAVPARPASRAGTPPTRWASRSTRWWCGIRTRSSAASSPSRCKRAKMILWKGHCSVHDALHRDADRGHPARSIPASASSCIPKCRGTSCRRPTTAAAPNTSSRPCSDSPVGSVWAVGTEVHLVNRLAKQLAPDRTVLSLDQFGCLCSTMFRVSPNHLLWILEELVEGRVHNRIVVPDEQKHWNRVALDRMLSIQ